MFKLSSSKTKSLILLPGLPVTGVCKPLTFSIIPLPTALPKDISSSPPLILQENNKYINAAVLTKQRKKLSLLNLAPEKNLQKGQLLVKLYSTSICGAQIGELLGKTGKDKWIPHCLGHEGYGKIIKKHRSVNKVRVNDDVIMHWRKSKRTNSKPTSYLSKNGVINAGLLTTFQTYAVVSENRLTKVNRFKKYTKIAPLLGCAFPTAWGILNKETNYTKNSQILIFGAGGIGLSLASIAKIQKFKRVILIDKSDYKKNITKKWILSI